MALFPKKTPHWLSTFLSKVPGFSNPDKHSIHFLNVAQFTGVLNDNIFKLVIAYLLIAILGQQHATTIMAVSGAIFVIPFLLLSSTAGTLADRFSKQRLMMLMKIVEMIIMLLAMIAFGVKSVWASYTLLFILASHSAMFGPSKYAIISELVPPEKVSSANGLITSFTYFGIIVGTFLASFLTQITDRNFVAVAAFGLLIAFIGFASTFGIKHTPPQQKDKKANWLFIQEIILTIRFCRTRKHLLLAMCGSAYFLFIGAFAQLNIIPFAIDSLKLTDIAGGYLFLCTAIGIAIGAFIGGRVSKKRVELGLSCIAGLFISFFLFLLFFFSGSLATVISLLVLLGVCGGLFIVPFDSFVQLYSPNEKRGQIIGANNFLSFGGVFIASFVLFLLGDVFGLAPATGFAIIGIITLLLSCFMILRLSDLALPFIARGLFRPFAKIETVNLELLEKNPGAILILKKATWKKVLFLLKVGPNIHLLVPKRNKNRFPYFKNLFYSIHLIDSDETYASLMEKGKKLSAESVNPCIMVSETRLPESLYPQSRVLSLLKGELSTFLYVDIEPSGGKMQVAFSKD